MVQDFFQQKHAHPDHLTVAGAQDGSPQPDGVPRQPGVHRDTHWHRPGLGPQTLTQQGRQLRFQTRWEALEQGIASLSEKGGWGRSKWDV